MKNDLARMVLLGMKSPPSFLSALVVVALAGCGSSASPTGSTGHPAGSPTTTSFRIPPPATTSASTLPKGLVGNFEGSSPGGKVDWIIRDVSDVLCTTVVQTDKACLLTRGSGDAQYGVHGTISVRGTELLLTETYDDPPHFANHSCAGSADVFDFSLLGDQLNLNSHGVCIPTGIPGILTRVP